jgi:hypothetical protein
MPSILLHSDATISGFADWWDAAEPRNRQSFQKPCGVTPARLLAVRRSKLRPFRRLLRGLAMTMDVKPSSGEMIWLTGRTFPYTDPPKDKAPRKSRAKLVLLYVLAIIGSVSWLLLGGPSDAESQPVPLRSPVLMSAKNASWFDPAITRIQATAPLTPAQATLVTPAETTPPAETAPADTAPTGMVPVEMAPVDGLKISSQSWRRGGLGSKALVTFTLRNGNDYAVKDIEISCAFARRDGSHLTDRTRVIHDTVNMKSRKTFARMHVGFVNINADRAKCSLVAASHI